jgi:ABC-type uncharacterized transport system permease subunit
MSKLLFYLLYAALFTGYVFFTLFIAYHISRYSLNKAVAAFAITLFLIGTALLAFSNAALFFSIPFENFDLPTLRVSPYSPYSSF